MKHTRRGVPVKAGDVASSEGCAGEVGDFFLKIAKTGHNHQTE